MTAEINFSVYQFFNILARSPRSARDGGMT